MRDDRKLDDLIQDVLDGVASAEDVARLKERLAADPAARALHARRSRLFGLLGELGAIETPAELPAGIMEAVRSEPDHSRQAAVRRRASLAWLLLLSRAAGRKRALTVGFAVAVAVAAVFLVRSRTGPEVQGTEGAIGAADRPGAGQVSEERSKDRDVQLFLQSELFQRMAADPDFRDVVSSEEFRRLIVSSADFRKLAATEAFRRLMAREDFARILGSPEFQRAVTTGELQRTLAPRSAAPR